MEINPISSQTYSNSKQHMFQNLFWNHPETTYNFSTPYFSWRSYLFVNDANSIRYYCASDANTESCFHCDLITIISRAIASLFLKPNVTRPNCKLKNKQIHNNCGKPIQLFRILIAMCNATLPNFRKDTIQNQNITLSKTPRGTAPILTWTFSKFTHVAFSPPSSTLSSMVSWHPSSSEYHPPWLH